MGIISSCAHILYHVFKIIQLAWEANLRHQTCFDQSSKISWFFFFCQTFPLNSSAHLKSFCFHVIFSHILFITLKHIHPATHLLINTIYSFSLKDADFLWFCLCTVCCLNMWVYCLLYICENSCICFYAPLYLPHGRTVAWAERLWCPGCRSHHRNSQRAARGGCSLGFDMGTPNAQGSATRYSSTHTSQKTATPHRLYLHRENKKPL